MKAYLQWLPMTYGIQSKAQRDLVLFLPALGSHSVLYVIRETVRLSILQLRISLVWFGYSLKPITDH